MSERLESLPVRGMGEIVPGTDLAAAITDAAPWLRDGDVLVVTSKIVSKAEGQLVDVPAAGPERETARAEILAAETARPVARRGHTHIVQTHHGFVMASAGIDASNVDRSRLVLLPKDPDASARALRLALRERYGLDVAVIISDTMGRPWRNGLTDVALGSAGIAPIRDHRGETDPYGNELHITQMAVIDELSGAAELVKGKCDQVPVAVVRGYLSPPGESAANGESAGNGVSAGNGEAAGNGGALAAKGDEEPGAVTLVRDAASDLFSLGTAEARAAGLAEAATLTDVATFGSGQVERAAVDRAVSRAAICATTTVTVAPADAAGRTAPPGAAFAVVMRPADGADPDQLIALGADVQRLRAALAAEGLASIWLHPALAVGSPPAGGPSISYLGAPR